MAERTAPAVRSLTSLLHPLRPVWRVAAGVGRTFAAIPRAVEAVLVLPKLSDQLGRVVDNTASLPTLSLDLERVVTNTDALAAMVSHTARIAEDTSVLPQTQSDLIVMQAAIVQMRADTASIAADLSGLGKIEQAVPAIVPMLEDVEDTVRRLAGVVEPLQGAATRFGRLADRLPRRALESNGR